MTTYCCTKCGLEKGIENFYQNPAKKNGLESNCKSCVLDRKAKKYKMKTESKKRKGTSKKKVLDMAKFKLREEFVKRNEDEEQHVLGEIFKIVNSANTLKVSGF